MHSGAGAGAADAPAAAAPAPAPAALPHDALVRIFSFLPRGALAVTPGRVCRAWRAGKAEAWAAVGPQLSRDEKYLPYLPAYYVREIYSGALFFHVKDRMIRGSVRHGLVDAVAAMYAVDPEEVGAKACVTAAGWGQLSILRRLLEQGSAWDEQSCAAAAARGGHLNVLVWMLEQGCAKSCFRLWSSAAIGGHVGILSWLHEIGAPWGRDTFSPFDAAAEGGCVDALNFLLEHGFPWRGVATCRAAAETGQLRALAWLREHGCEWDESTCHAAAQRGHLETLKWCREQAPPCPWSYGTTYSAAYGGQLETLQWCVANGCPINVEECIRGAFDFPLCQDWLETLLPADE